MDKREYIDLRELASIENYLSPGKDFSKLCEHDSSKKHGKRGTILDEVNTTEVP